MGENDQPTDAPEPSTEQGGVFGNLPRSRPGTRSPRRERPGAAAADPAPEPAPAPEPPADLGPDPEPDLGDEGAREPEAELPGPRPGDQRSEAEAEDERSAGNLEDLAWAGVAAAAEAATIGVRLASRAMEAVRDSVERR